MDTPAARAPLTPDQVRALLNVTRRLGAPVELRTMLQEVTAAACGLLSAERASVWLLDERTQELVLEIASDVGAVRIPLTVGLSGASARTRSIIDVPDCYADPRFDPSIDRRSGFRTRNSLSLPLDAIDGRLVGVLQVLNRADASGEPLPLAEALAAQCAAALARAQAHEQMRERERLRRDLELARLMQGSALPRTMPQVAGYGLHASFLPAEQTGGDIYDVVPHAGDLLLVLADAAGHGIGPALSVLQLQAMLRFGLRSGMSLARLFRHVNDELCERLPDGHFITAFVGRLDPLAHRLQFVSGGQAPILHYVAAERGFRRHRATSFPMGAMVLDGEIEPRDIELAPGDWLLLLSDGIFEQESADGSRFGRDRAEALLRDDPGQSPQAYCEQLLGAVRSHAADAQDDDMTMLVLKRDEPC